MSILRSSEKGKKARKKSHRFLEEAKKKKNTFLSFTHANAERKSFCNSQNENERRSKELNHFGVIAGLFRQIGSHSSRFVLFCSFWRLFTKKIMLLLLLLLLLSYY